jgi:hypothetical protein
MGLTEQSIDLFDVIGETATRHGLLKWRGCKMVAQPDSGQGK